MNMLSPVADFASIVVALTSLAAIIISTLALRLSRKSQDAVYIFELSKMYASDEMLHSLEILAGWRDKNEKGSLFNIIKNNYKKGVYNYVVYDDVSIQELNVARRKVKFYFDEIARLRETNVISDSSAESLAIRGGLLLYFEAVDPIGDALRKGRDENAYSYLLKIRESNNFKEAIGEVKPAEISE